MSFIAVIAVIAVRAADIASRAPNSSPRPDAGGDVGVAELAAVVAAQPDHHFCDVGLGAGPARLITASAHRNEVLRRIKCDIPLRCPTSAGFTFHVIAGD
ncbi:hypothetical protein [Nonomuraea lactucae]|uniref:hypothetical protein n=1 Tax=Nonomuraea lactucae TaxID=2249762 RepID=UPI0013B42D30|nr:hypothetical protein [Nonomuraea lactucae]